MKLYMILSFLVLAALGSHAQLKNPYASLKYDKVLMYDFDGTKGYNSSIIDSEGELASTVIKIAQLDIEESKQLSALVGLRSSYGAGAASCFDPHLGFVYYLNGKVVGHITVCMDCNLLRGDQDIPAKLQGREKVEGIEDVYIYTASGMSKPFRKFLNGLLIKNMFSHQIDKEDMWGGY